MLVLEGSDHSGERGLGDNYPARGRASRTMCRYPEADSVLVDGNSALDVG